MEIIVVLARVLFASFANVFQKQLAHQGHHPLFIVMASYAVLSIISIPVLFWVNINELSPYSNFAGVAEPGQMRKVEVT